MASDPMTLSFDHSSRHLLLLLSTYSPLKFLEHNFLFLPPFPLGPRRSVPSGSLTKNMSNTSPIVIKSWIKYIPHLLHQMITGHINKALTKSMPRNSSTAFLLQRPKIYVQQRTQWKHSSQIICHVLKDCSVPSGSLTKNMSHTSYIVIKYIPHLLHQIITGNMKKPQLNICPAIPLRHFSFSDKKYMYNREPNGNPALE